MRFPIICAVASMATQTNAFAPRSSNIAATAARTSIPTSTGLNVAPIGPEHLHALDADTINAAANQLHEYFASSTLLADAAAATADAVEASPKEGWWNSYLEFMKGGLSLVHSTIDGPLRKVGIEQTWGPSIFLFTAGKCLPKDELLVC